MIRRIIILAALCVASVGAWAQSLTPTQLAALRTNILAGNMAAQCQPFGDGPTDIATAYNAPASPAFVVWRSNVRTSEIGPALNYQAVAALTSANRDRATTFVILNPDSFNASADIASYWDTTFGGALDGQGAATRAALQALWRRGATRFERIYASGTGSDAAPGVIVVAGPLTPDVVRQACSQ